ncbi:hypothetical protein EH32_14705 [Erythrobacter litoralis]|uniref:Uncharacterized protein n=1 Tax=Erythrobacter litoralis TaxID=39960 RepID=A0A074N3I4_9SPHN|nr:hypothetical protein [Erythrobacter litoralis]KEO92507.1 hypothetical protein EH32_14705 [Erythrobacter litoralis]
MLISNRALAFIAAACLAAPSYAQVAKPDADVEDIARTPLEDLNIDGDEIPPVLIEAAEDPYAREALTDCNAIVAEIARIDRVLGPDYDYLGRPEGGLKPGRVAKGLVGSLIPFRGIVREVTGAAGEERELIYAITAGMVRRGFLKGLGMGRGCDYPATPRTMTMEEELAADEQASKAQAAEEQAAEEQAAQEPPADPR